MVLQAHQLGFFHWTEQFCKFLGGIIGKEPLHYVKDLDTFKRLFKLKNGSSMESLKGPLELCNENN